MRSILIAALLLAGCASGPREVRVPTPVRCLNPADLPQEVPPTGQLPDDARSASLILAAAILALRANDRAWREITRPCVR